MGQDAEVRVKHERILSAGSSVLRPLLGIEPPRDDKGVRLPDLRTQKHQEGARVPLVNSNISCVAFYLTQWKLPRRKTAQI